MKPSVLVLLLLASGACSPAADQTATPRPIFRHFNTEVSNIQLGQSWTAEEVPGADPGDTVVALAPGTFERAQSVRVHRTPAGLVSSIMFDYPDTANFQAMQSEYSRLLGPPRQHQKPANDKELERLVWQDSLTRFELVRDPKRSAAVYTRLSDLSGGR
jgi:hypothetical protein